MKGLSPDRSRFSNSQFNAISTINITSSSIYEMTVILCILQKEIITMSIFYIENGFQAMALSRGTVV